MVEIYLYDTMISNEYCRQYNRCDVGAKFTFQYLVNCRHCINRCSFEGIYESHFYAMAQMSQYDENKQELVIKKKINFMNAMYFMYARRLINIIMGQKYC